MSEEEIVGGFDAREENFQGQKSASWMIRCAPAQKEFLQEAVYRSGLNVADFLVQAAKDAEAVPKTKAETELDKDLSEMDGLIERLTRMMRAKLVFAHEAQKSSAEEQRVMILKQEQNEEELARQTEEASKQIQDIREALEEEFLQKKQHCEKSLEDSNKVWEEKCTELNGINERLESNLSHKIQESKIREKQYADSVRLHENIEEKNTELKTQNETLKKELEELRKYKDSCVEKISYLEKQENILTHQLEIQKMKQEDEVKRLGSEYELKCKIAEFEIEKRILESLKG